MIHHVTGRVVHRTPARVVLDVSGVGLMLDISLTTHAWLEQQPPQGPVTLLCRLNVQENAPHLRLFGFSSEEERRIFDRLLDVPKIGPLTALRALSSGSPAELVAAIRSGDVKRLERVKGVGRKTAERVIFALRDKLDDVGGGSAPGGAGASGVAFALGATPSPSFESDAARDAYGALVLLEIPPPRAHEAVARALSALGKDAPVEALIRAALR